MTTRAMSIRLLTTKSGGSAQKALAAWARTSHSRQPCAATQTHTDACRLALVMENLGRLGIGPQPPLLTRYVVLSTCRDFYFSAAKAGRDFGCEPVVSAEQAFQEALAWLQEQAPPR
jgi:hypothetical protein